MYPSTTTKCSRSSLQPDESQQWWCTLHPYAARLDAEGTRNHRMRSYENGANPKWLHAVSASGQTACSGVWATLRSAWTEARKLLQGNERIARRLWPCRRDARGNSCRQKAGQVWCWISPRTRTSFGPRRLCAFWRRIRHNYCGGRLEGGDGVCLFYFHRGSSLLSAQPRWCSRIAFVASLGRRRWL